MRNLIRAQFFQIKRNRILLFIVGGVTLMNIVEVFGEGMINSSNHSMGFVFAQAGVIMFLLASMAGVLSAVLCSAEDFRDKTFNYEIMSGHNRRDIFISKVIVGLCVGIIGYLISIVIPVVVGCAVLGFGSEITVGEFLLRIVLSIVVEVRLICVFIGITYLFRNLALGLGVSGAYLFLGLIFLEGITSKSILLGITSFAKLAEFVDWMTYTIGDKINYIYVYGKHIAFSEGLSLVAVSLGIGIAMLLISYYFFKKDDVE